MFDRIESLILLNIDILFNKEINGFKITMRHKEKEEMVVLPYSHLTELKINKYIDLMADKLLEEPIT
jgi:hypothetical protein